MSKLDYSRPSDAEWQHIPRWRKKFIRFQAEFNFNYPHWSLLYSRFQAPFSYLSWRSAIPGFITAFVIVLFALTLPPEHSILLFKNWQTYSAFALLCFGVLSIFTQASHSISAEDYLSVSAFLLHAFISIATFSFAATYLSLPIFSVLFLLSFATALAMINTMTCYYFLSLFFKVARI